MERRRLLRFLGTAGLAAGAGCISGGGGGGQDTTETTTETPTTAETTTTRTTTATTETTAGPVDRSIADARENLRSVAERLSPSPTPTESQQSMDSFTVDDLKGRIAAAEGSLDEAADGGPDEDQRGRIERLRAIADFLGGYVDFLVVVRDATRAFKNATFQVESGVYDDATSLLESAKSNLETAREQLDAIDAKATEVGSFYDPGEDVFDGELRDLMNESAEWDTRFDVFASLVDGELGLVTALQSYSTGVSDYSSEEYGAAAEAFSTAENAASDAVEHYQQATSSSLVMNFGIDPGARACRAENVAEAATNYHQAAVAAGEGRSGDAGEARSAAEAAFEREC